MLTIGLTGGIGSGKTTVANLFQKKGITIIDTDELARELTTPGQVVFDIIIKHFGDSFLLPNQTLDRKRLRKIIFKDPKERRWLEKQLHPLIRQEMKKKITLARSPYCIAVIPLLLETKPNPLIQRILVVDTPEESQRTRAADRDKTTKNAVDLIIKTQIQREKRLHAADDVIYNHGDISELIPQVEKLHTLYLSLADKDTIR